MAGVYHHKVFISLRVEMLPDVWEGHMAASPVVVGENLAELVDSYTREHRLGYYPALEFFRDQGLIDKDLLEAADGIAWLMAKMAREEIRKRLRAAFSSVSFETVQTIAFTMPPVRPGQANALHDLTRHFTPNALKIDLIVNLIRRNSETEGLARFARQALTRWIEDSFARVEVSESHLVNPP
jgi:hypothetical protein